MFLLVAVGFVCEIDVVEDVSYFLKCMLWRGAMTLAKMAPNDDLSDLQKCRGNQCLAFSM